MLIKIPPVLTESNWKKVQSKIQFKTGISAELRAFEKLAAAFQRSYGGFSGPPQFDKMVKDIEKLTGANKKKAQDQLQKTLTGLFKAMMDLDTQATKVAKLAKTECAKADGFFRKKLTNKESVDYLKQVQKTADSFSIEIQLVMDKLPFDWARGPVN